MKWLSSGLTLVNVATVCAVLFGMVAGGLNKPIAAIAVLLGVAAAVLAFRTTIDSDTSEDPGVRSAEQDPRSRFRSAWFWLIAGCFAFFAFRAFCWLLFLDGNDLKVQSANNLGDLALHLTYIKNFANGVALWPDNPIYVFSQLRYPAGTDLFNALLLLLDLDLTHGLIWAGLIGSLATFYALYRWGGVFGVAGFLFNGGLAGFQLLQTWKLLDYQGDKTVAWKNLALSMFVTQRGLLYALPAGLLLLYHWRSKYFPPQNSGVGGEPRGPLPFWIELTLYATMPLFHVHTFIALSIVAAFLFAIGHFTMRKQLALLAAAAFVPATFFVWMITDHFQARSLLAWKPGWVQNAGDFAAPFFSFWFVNFGILIPLVLLLLGICVWRAVPTRGGGFTLRDHPCLAFLAPAAFLFLFACLVKTAPWEWDNIKIIIWAYLIALPFLWRDLIAHWPIPVRAGVCVALFFSGFVSLFGGLIGAEENGYGFADRAELDAVGMSVQKLPIEDRFAGYPTYNHPLLLQGRKMVLGYPGHLWTQGFDYGAVEKNLNLLMAGAPGWKEQARQLRARYLFWGRYEKLNYPRSARPWEGEATVVASGPWGSIYDLESAPEDAVIR
jgi:hypothetical protein